MTPLQFAREQCANYEHDGSCKGIGIRDDGSLYIFGKKPVCVLSERKTRCAYFEQCVLPMGIEPVNARNVQRERDRQEALKIYAANAPEIARRSGRLCPDCRQREVEPRHRVCYDCAEKRRRQSKTRHMRKTRSHVDNLASVSTCGCNTENASK